MVYLGVWGSRTSYRPIVLLNVLRTSFDNSIDDSIVLEHPQSGPPPGARIYMPDALSPKARLYQKGPQALSYSESLVGTSNLGAHQEWAQTDQSYPLQILDLIWHLWRSIGEFGSEYLRDVGYRLLTPYRHVTSTSAPSSCGSALNRVDSTEYIIQTAVHGVSGCTPYSALRTQSHSVQLSDDSKYREVFIRVIIRA